MDKWQYMTMNTKDAKKVKDGSDQRKEKAKPKAEKARWYEYEEIFDDDAYLKFGDLV